jgi:iron(III) transport system ATP-binding protein
MSVLRIVNLVKKYGKNIVVDNLNLEVHDGEFVTLLGPSGCGKTTTLRALAGLVEIDSGEIYFDDQLMNDVPANKRSASMVFQTYALFPHMTVKDNVAFGLKMQKIDKKERDERALASIELMGLQDLADRKPGQLSGGQQQRVAVARAIVTQPKFLLFDEPLSNLDLKLRERLRVEIRELQKRLNITSVYVTHDQAEALVISDRIAVMDKGRIVQLDDPATIYNRPSSAFTAEFIGQANILHGRIQSKDANNVIVDSPIGLIKTNELPAFSGLNVLVCWRPEDMVVYTDGMANRIVGKVLRSIFMGNLTDVFVEINNVVFRVQMAGLTNWKSGDEIILGLPSDKVRLIEA